MNVRCISCKKFSLKARPANGSNEWLRERDIRMVALGFGLCTLKPATNTWHSQEYEHTCAKHDPLTIEQTDQRRALADDRRTKMIERSQ